MSRPSSTIADHFNLPRNAGEMRSPDAVGHASLDGRAPRVTIYLKTDGKVISQAMFQTFGCGFSIAACSLLTELVAGKTFDECLSLSDKTLIAALNGMPPEREFCAQLAMDALRDAISQIAPT